MSDIAAGGKGYASTRHAHMYIVAKVILIKQKLGLFHELMAVLPTQEKGLTFNGYCRPSNSLDQPPSPNQQLSLLLLHLLTPYPNLNLDYLTLA